jgi:glycosyltransferase involved in cell wall biosynthesis
LAFITLVAYAADQGGTTRVLRHLASGFAAAGHRVAILYCTSTGLAPDLAETPGPGIETHALTDRRWGGRALGQIATFLTYRRWLRHHRPDIVLATGNNINWFAALGMLSTKPRGRYYIKTTNPIVRESDGRVTGWLRRAIYGLIFRRAAGVLTLSDAETAILQSQFPRARDRFRTVRNAYLTDAFAAPRRDRARTDGPILLLGAGRLSAQKRFDRLLRAFAAAGPVDARLRIAGDGPDRAALATLAADLGVADRVEMIGYTPDIPAQMAAADLFVLSSDYEGLPAVVIEALASDLPVVSTDCFASTRELLTGLPGCAVVDRSTEALASALRAWLAAPPEHSDLRRFALPYSTANAVASHLAAMGEGQDNHG